MLLRKTTTQDLDAVEQILNDAKASMKASGIDQWQDGYPNKEVVAQDIKNEEAYVVEIDGGVFASCMISIRKEASYDHIEGAWLNLDPCIVIHRIATKKEALSKGVATYCIEQAFALFPTYKNIKIDTHPDNKRMQAFLAKNGFIHCGTIYLDDGGLRLAFQKSIS